MNWELYGLYLVSGLLIALTPGPNTFFTVSQALRRGRVAMLPVLAGLIGSTVTYALLAFIGVGALLVTYPLALEIIRWLGIAFLLHLAYSLWRQAGQAMEAAGEDNPALRRRTAMEAYLVGLSNPTSVMLYLVYLPQFVDPGHPVLPQLGLLASSQVVVNSLVWAGYILLAAEARQMLAGPGRIALVQRISAGLMALAAGLLAWSSLKSGHR